METIEEKINKVLDLGDNLKSVHDAPIMDMKQNEAIRLLAKEIDDLKFDLRGLHEWKITVEGI